MQAVFTSPVATARGSTRRRKVPMCGPDDAPTEIAVCAGCHFFVLFSRGDAASFVMAAPAMIYDLEMKHGGV